MDTSLALPICSDSAAWRTCERMPEYSTRRFCISMPDEERASWVSMAMPSKPIRLAAKEPSTLPQICSRSSLKPISPFSSAPAPGSRPTAPPAPRPRAAPAASGAPPRPPPGRDPRPGAGRSRAPCRPAPAGRTSRPASPSPIRAYHLLLPLAFRRRRRRHHRLRAVDDARSDEDEQLRAIVGDRLLLEEPAQDGDLGEDGHLVP